MSFKFSNNMSDADFAKGLKSLRSRAASYRRDVVFMAMSIMSSWKESGDAKTAASKATLLVQHVDGAHAQKVLNWFEVKAAFQWDNEEETFKYTATTLDAEAYKAAEEENIYDLTKDSAPKSIDLTKLLAQVVARADKRLVDGVKDGDNIDRDLLAKVQALLA